MTMVSSGAAEERLKHRRRLFETYDANGGSDTFHTHDVCHHLHGRLGFLNRLVGGLASGKRLHDYGKSPFLMGKSTIDGHFQ
jgi:hypothetical protein